MKTQQPQTYGTTPNTATPKIVLKGRFIALQVYIWKQEKSQINNLALYLKQLEKNEMKNPKFSKRI